MLLPRKRSTSRTAKAAWQANVRTPVPRGRPVFDDYEPGQPRPPYSPAASGSPRPVGAGIVAPGATAPVPVASPGSVVRPSPTSVGSVDPFLASLAANRDAQLGRIRGNWAGFTSELQGALAGLLPAFGQIYDRAEAAGAATNAAVADRLGISGQQAETALGQKMAQINAPGTAAADIGGLYKGAAGSGFAYGASDVQRLNEEGAAAEAYASKIPFITGLEGARIAGSLMSEVEDDYRNQSTNYIKEKAAMDKEERRYQEEQKRYREEVEREERQRLEDRAFEAAQARAAQRQREKEFMLTLMADATEAQRKAAEKRLEREWEKEDAQIKRQHEVEMANLRSSNTSSNQAANRAAINAQQDRTREDQQAFAAAEAAKARAAAAKRTRESPTTRSVGEWQVNQARNAVYSRNNKGQIIWNASLRRKLVASPRAADGIINGAINTQLRAGEIDPFSKQGTAIRRGILQGIDGKIIPGTQLRYRMPKPKPKPKKKTGK